MNEHNQSLRKEFEHLPCFIPFQNYFQQLNPPLWNEVGDVFQRFAASLKKCHCDYDAIISTCEEALRKFQGDKTLALE